MQLRVMVPLLAGGLTLFGHVQTTHRVLSPRERFALELRACQDAHARGKPGKCALYGKIQFVSSFPDVKVQEVRSFPDIKVQMVKSFPDKPGKWQEVSSFPDYKVQIVKSFPDYKIQYVNSFPGCH